MIAVARCCALALVFMGLGACSGEADPPRPRWMRLAQGFVPSAHEGLGRAPRAWSGGTLRISTGASRGSAVCDLTLEKASWTKEGQGFWSLALPLPAIAPHQNSPVQAFTLRNGEEIIQQFSPEELKRVRHSPTGAVARSRMLKLGKAHRPRFAVISGRIYLLLEQGRKPQPTLVLQHPLYLGREVQGVWRLHYEDLVADGIPVLPGTSEQLQIALPAHSALRFRTIAVGGPAKDSGEGPPMVRFVVRLDGKIIFEHRQPPTVTPTGAAHVVILPPQARQKGSLSFEVHGPQALTAFAQPVVGPAAAGGFAQRPWPRQRPDIVLCVGDTFRPDNMAAWGGDPLLTPNLNRFANQSRRYLTARAPATATITSQAALFSGLHPPQNGVRNGLQSLTEEAYTLTEHLQAAGYRTLAITDAGQVSWRYGMAQGFESYEQSWDTDFAATLESAAQQLALDDGRPLFLFVHSYRSHNPYRVSAQTRARLIDKYPFAGLEFEALLPLALKHAKEGTRGKPLPTGEPSIQHLQQLYRGSAADLDAGFGKLFEKLQASELLQGAVVVYTSDHGESFGAHGVLGHGSGVWDDEALVPLFLRAPGIEAGEDLAPVSLLDLAPTLSRLAGLEPPANWSGRDLFSGHPPQPVFTFTGTPDTRLYEVAIVVEGRKLIFGATQGPGELRHAYDLVSDPGEKNDLRAAPWAQRLARELAGALAQAFRPEFGSTRAKLSPALRRQLDALGYTGGPEDKD